MAYCRLGDDSEAYAYCGMMFEIYVPSRDISYTCETLAEFKVKMEHLRDSGVNIPEYAFDMIDKDLRNG
jgi:hypothetical protein